MDHWKAVPIIVGLAGVPMLGGCAAAAGGAAGYEYSNKRAMDELDADFRAGRIGKEEYLQRKKEIEKRSAIQ